MKYLIPAVLIILAVILVYTFRSTAPSSADYIREVEKHRDEIDSFMKNDPRSPFSKKGELEYKGLNYYNIDPDYKVNAQVIKLMNPELINIPMSDGSYAGYYRYAIAKFDLHDTSQQVVLLKSKEYWNEDWVFLPFYDETSAEETYGGGRYLEVDYDGGDEAIIDFNLAYNPYCAYNDDYSCPIPPRENHITVEVKAGEKKYKAPH